MSHESKSLGLTKLTKRSILESEMFDLLIITPNLYTFSPDSFQNKIFFTEEDTLKKQKTRSFTFSGALLKQVISHSYCSPCTGLRQSQAKTHLAITLLVMYVIPYCCFILLTKIAPSGTAPESRPYESLVLLLHHGAVNYLHFY